MSHVIAFAIAIHSITAQATSAWRDPSPHKVQFVTVDSSVRLEVLDWGGRGRPLLFIGCYQTAHAYDDIAPKLTEHFRVYAVTRRGLGASDRPATGYDPQRRADDIVNVMDALRLDKPILVGHSCGGWILHTIGAEHPERVGGLAYLEAAEDPTLGLSDYPSLPGADPAKLPKPVRKESPVVFPEAERREMAERPVEPVIRKAIVDDHKVRPDYSRITVPVLAIYRTTTLEQALKLYEPQNDQQRALLFQLYAATRGMLEKWQADLRAGVPHARIVELPGANLYMYLSNEADVIRELRAFAATLPH
jgi:pimeloyl-ACP methyl ester carboxylesterase